MVGRTINSPSKDFSTTSKDTTEVNIIEVGKMTGKDTDVPEGDGNGPVVNNEETSLTIPSGPESDGTPSPKKESITESDDSPMSLVTKGLITIKVKDFVGVFGPTEAEQFVYAPETTFGEFFLEVANRFKLALGEFDIVYQDKAYSYNLSGFPEDHTFTGIGIKPRRDKIYWMSLDVHHNSRKRKNRPLDTVSGESAEEPITSGDALSGFLDISSPKRDFVGLKNRNMTCYLNSFLQGLWFTPEFRNVVYNYVYEPGRFNKKSLCLPLQRLFLQQQFSIRDSIDTDDLIKTFGWEDRETWNQHDIEELCSIFMENLTAEFRGTKMEGLIHSLYFGQLDDYVKCLECGRVSQRTDDFLVIPLPIKPFGSTVAYPTLEAALNSFVAYEVLDGNNMYNCSQCEKKCPAHKGFKFNRLPYILTIQLKRFEYDFIKDRRLKLNDRVAFPFVLDMNPYVENPSPDRRDALKVDLIKPASQKEGIERKTHSRPSIVLNDPDEVGKESKESKEETVGASGGNERSNMKAATLFDELVKSEGPEIYQLFGVMVHRGGINSGHYYAYILDFEREKWFRCDDAVIRPASVADIEGSFGGMSDDDRELTSAYMLLYRRFDSQLNMLPYFMEELPPQMKEMWDAIASFDIQLHEEEELAKNTIKMPCFFQESNSTELTERTVQIPKSLSLAEAAVFIYQEFTEKGTPPPGPANVRVVRYDRDLQIIENSFEGCEDDMVITALRKRPQATKNEGLLLEKKEDAKQFQIYRPDDLVFRTYMVDHVKREVLFPMFEVHVGPNALVGDLRENIRNRIDSIQKEEMCLVAHSSDRYCLISGDKFPLNLFKFERISNLYVDYSSNENAGEGVLDFIEQYTKAEVTQIYVQVPPNFGEKDKQAEVADAQGETATPPTSSVPPDVPQTGVGEGIGEQSKNDGNENVAIEQAVTPDTIPPVVEDKVAPAPKKVEYFIKFTNQCATDEQDVLAYTLRIDGQTPLYALSKSISSLIKVAEKDFVLYKTEKSETTELRRMTERLSTIKPFDRILVKMEHRLQDGEFRIPIFLLSVGCAEKPLDFLAEIVVTLNMTLDELRSFVISKFDVFKNYPEIDKSRVRIRKKLRSNPSKIMRENAKLQDLFTMSSIHVGELFVQILNEPVSLTDKTYCIMFRLWHPSTGSLDAPVEITVFHDYSNDLEELILNKIQESLKFGEEIEIEVAKPEGGYPWEIPSKLIQDLAWFSLVPPAKKSLYVYSDELALFVRDKNEMPMDFEKAEANCQSNNTKTPVTVEPPRRETGLKINLADSPTKS